MANFRIVDTVEGFEALREKWERIFAANEGLRFSQSFEWNYGVWTRYYAKERKECRLCIVDGYQDGHAEQCAIVPMMIDGENTLRFLGDTYADIMGEVVPAHKDNWHMFYRDLVRFIKETADGRQVRLTKMTPDDELLQYLGVYYEDESKAICKSHNYTYCETKQGDDLNTGFPQCTSKERSYLRSLAKKNFSCEFKLYSKQRGEKYPKEAIVRLRDWMLEKGMRTTEALPDGLIETAGEMYDDGRCEVAVFEHEGKFELASFRIHEHGGGAHFVNWVVLHSNAQMTTAADVQYMMLKMATEDCIFNFGTGAYSYKLGTFHPQIKQLYSFSTKQRTMRNLVRDLKGLARFYLRPFINRIRKRGGK